MADDDPCPNCGHQIGRHQKVTRDVDTGQRPMRRKLRQRAQPVTTRAWCTVPGCDCARPT